MQTGTLKIELTTGGALPVNDAVVRVKTISGELLYEQAIPVGDEGISSSFELEVPDMVLSLNQKEVSAPYGLFDVEVLTGDFIGTFINGVQVFAGMEALLQIPLQPRTEAFPSSNQPNTFNIPPNALRLPPKPEGDTATLFPQSPSSQLHAFPYIPEYITVHLGSPTDFSARNVTVTFQDYIKNVASSEIYPTWPEESLRANIIAQISFVLNRVYTEWYRSRGYDFDITNDTAFDQYFVEGRNIFKNISQIVDDIFNVYMQKPGREEPFFARYCNGTTSRCDGLSQWGTVTLANDGLDAQSILEYYYGDIELVETDDLRGPFESYPGNPLRVGTSGEPVRRIQEQLNRIALNYPSIPFISVDGVYGESTERSVRQFQKIFNLDTDGIVGKGTWYAISRVYVAVKDLAELTSEGERVDYAAQEYPGTPLKLGDRSVEVLEIQLYLSTIALYNPEVKTVAIDGVFGQSTLNSVVSFQRAYGIDPDGVVGRVTWDRLVDVYNGIKNNVQVPPVGGTVQLQPYPGAPLNLGAEGNTVVYVRKLLDALSNIYADISPINITNVYDEELARQVRAFQGLVSLPETGVVDEKTWNYLNDLYRKEASSYFPDLGERPFPGRALQRGARGENVRYLQRGLERVRVKYPELPQVRVDGVFGTDTESAVRAFQRLFGLLPDGIVGKFTWDTLNQAIENIATPVTPRDVLADTEPTLSEVSTEEKTESVATETAVEEKTPEASAVSVENTTHRRIKMLGRCERFERPLRVGCVGADVEKMKKALCEKGILANNASNGDIFGIATRRAVEILQRESGLNPTGRVDEETWTEIFR
ncbi:MAG: spore cortex-lytic protein [Ruminococcaceae bacterium]|nr:spore cortex-lytic protein [Oscillospiraceae bacterium]